MSGLWGKLLDHHFPTIVGFIGHWGMVVPWWGLTVRPTGWGVVWFFFKGGIPGSLASCLGPLPAKFGGSGVNSPFPCVDYRDWLQGVLDMLLPQLNTYTTQGRFG